MTLPQIILLIVVGGISGLIIAIAIVSSVQTPMRLETSVIFGGVCGGVCTIIGIALAFALVGFGWN
jgi:hypothetical protein